MDYAQTIDYLFNSVSSFQQVGASAYKPGLERVESFCRSVGNPQRNFLAVHVAGTNGKGSTSHMIASVLQSAGYRVGLYTSPHLKDFRERMRVDGEMISEQEVVRFVGEHKSLIEELSLSFFEITTVMAFDFFSRSDVEVAVIETGLGGRLDATNVILPILSVVTNIGLDHTEFLGSTLPKVATEKAGIIKPKVAVVLGESSEEYDFVFIERASALGSKLIFAEREFECQIVQSDDESSDCVERKMQEMLLIRKRDGRRYHVELDLVGEYQHRNVVTASAALDYLHQHTALTIPTHAYIEGLGSVVASTHLQGRWQVLSQNPLVVCDTGHNAHGLRYVMAELERRTQHCKVICVMGFAKEKDLSHVLPLMPKRAYYIFTQAAVSRAMSADLLAEAASAQGLHGEVVRSVADALAKAKQMASVQDMIFVGGSNFVVAEIL